MNQKIAQQIEQGPDGHWYIQYDWYPMAIPDNVVMEDMVYLDTTYSFASFHSQQPDGFQIGFASGNYLHSRFLSGKNGCIKIGKYVILESTNITANDSVVIGDHCMFSWGSFVTDSWLNESTYSSETRKAILKDLANSQNRYLNLPNPSPVIIEENVWVGFDSVIMPGVRLGRGCVIGCKTVISESVPSYAVVVGNPSRIIKYLEPDDTLEVKELALKQFLS